MFLPILRPSITTLLLTPPLALLLLSLYLITKSRLRARRHRLQSTLYGCTPPPTLTSTNLLGTSRLRESIRATKADRGPQYVVAAMDSLGPAVHTCRVPILDHEVLVTRDPDNVRAMFSAQAADYDISAARANGFMPLLGEGIFTSTGAQWKHSRALVRPQFSREELENLDLVERHVRTLLQVLRVGEGGWTTACDLQPLFFAFTLDTATEFLYGQSVYSQAAMAGLAAAEPTWIDGAAFSHHFGAAKHLIDKRGALGKFSWLMPMKEMRRHCAAIHQVIDRMIAERLRTNADDKLSLSEKGSRKFVLLDELAKETSDLRELRNETLHTLMAGRDPTGALLGWVFYFLARHPQIYAHLRSLVLASFGAALAPAALTPTAFRRCEYLQHVLHETIRMVAIIPMNERVALRDTTLPRGGGPGGEEKVFVPKGRQVLVPLYAMQHRKDIWGKDVEIFRPERWEGRRIGWEWVPFGGGARKCLGQQFALTEASYLIVTFLQRFDAVENMEQGDGEIKLHTAIENRSGTGVHVRFHAAAA